MKFEKKDNNLIICADSTTQEVKDLIKQELGIEKVPLIVTDPPYGNIIKKDWDKATANDYIGWAKVCESYIEDNGSAFMWGGIGKPKDRVFFDFLSRVETETNLTIRNLITWKKKRAYGKKNDYLFVREELVWLLNGDKPKTFNIPLLDKKRGYAGYSKKYPAKSEYLRRTNVWDDITEVMRGGDHPTIKPSKLAEVLIETHSISGDYVLDLFAGTGSTGIAAKKLDRKFILVDNNESYYDKMVDKLFKNWKG